MASTIAASAIRSAVHTSAAIPATAGAGCSAEDADPEPAGAPAAIPATAGAGCIAEDEDPEAAGAMFTDSKALATAAWTMSAT